MWYNSVWKGQTQRTWSGLVFIAQLARLYAGPFFNKQLNTSPTHGTKKINKKEVKVLFFFNTRRV